MICNERMAWIKVPPFFRPTGTLFSKKYGVDLIRYPHGDLETVVYSSNKLDGNQYSPCTFNMIIQVKPM